MRSILFIAFILLAVLAGGAAASANAGDQVEENLAGTVSIGDLIAQAYAKNPSIVAAREAWNAVVEDYRTTTQYPDPELRFTYFPDPIETRLGPQDWTASLNQKIPFPGKLSKAGDVVAAEARVAHIALDRTVKEVMAQVRLSFHELRYIREARDVAAHNLTLLNHLRKVGETAYARDRAALMDMVKAQSQVGQLRYDQILLDELEQTEQTRLNGLLNRPPQAPMGRLVPEAFLPLAFDLEGLYRLAEANQDEVRTARAMVDKAGARVDLARFENLPDFNVGLFYSAIGEPDMAVRPPDAGKDAFGVQVGITIPLWFEKNRGRVGRAEAEMRKAKAEETASVNDIRTLVHQLFFRLRNADRLIKLYGQDLLPQAVEAMEIAETWYREGQSSFADFVETQAVTYNFQLSLARARADYGKYLALLEQVAGQSITKPSGGNGKNRQEETP